MRLFAKILVFLFVSVAAFAASNQSLVYQGRVVRPDGLPPNSGTITFTLALYSPSTPTCLLYSENQVVDMTNSYGMFSLKLGTGTRSDGGSHPFNQVFVNGMTLASLTCAAGTTYTSNGTDDRRLIVSFNDGGTIVTLDPMEIKSVPFAMQAHEIDGWGISNLVKVSSLGSATTFTFSEMAKLKSVGAASGCIAGNNLQWNGTTWACGAGGGAGGSSGSFGSTGSTGSCQGSCRLK